MKYLSVHDDGTDDKIHPRRIRTYRIPKLNASSVNPNLYVLTFIHIIIIVCEKRPKYIERRVSKASSPCFLKNFPIYKFVSIYISVRTDFPTGYNDVKMRYLLQNVFHIHPCIASFGDGSTSVYVMFFRNFYEGSGTYTKEYKNT